MTTHASSLGTAPTSQNTLLETLLANGSLPAIVSTKAAAELLGRRPQTLRIWACRETGPIRPVRINGRLAWRVTDLQNLLNGTRSAAGK